MTKLRFLLCLLPTLALGQSVPNGGAVSNGQVWTVAQWMSAWQSKADTASPIFTGGMTLNGVGVPTNASPAFTGTITLNGVNVPTVASPAFTGTPTIGGVAIPTVSSPAFTGSPTIAGVPIPTYPQTVAELSAGVTPTQFNIAPCNVNRYGVNTTPGTTDMSVAFANAVASCTSVYVPAGTYVVQLVMPSTVRFTLRGDGQASLLKQKGTGSVLSWSTSSIVYSEQTVSDLAFDGTNGGTHTINTSGAGGLTLRNLYFSQIPTGFDLIFVNGAAATTVHDIRIFGIQAYTTQSGAAGIEFGSLSADAQLTQFVMNGNFTTGVCLQIDSGAVGITVNDSHPYNCLTHVLQVAGGFSQFTHNTFDNASGGDNTLIIGSSNIVFSGNYFENVPAAKNAVTLTNSAGIGFYNNIFLAQSGAGYAVAETGTSNNNSIVGGSISVLANWTAGVFSLIAPSSYSCNVPGPANINCPGNLQSVVVGSPTGGNKGTGSVNATSIYINNAPLNPTLVGTTGSIGGGALTAGACASGTAAITGLTTGMAVAATPVTYPGDGNAWMAYTSAAGTATVKVCAVVAGTPISSAYNVRALQ